LIGIFTLLLAGPSYGRMQNSNPNKGAGKIDSDLVSRKTLGDASLDATVGTHTRFIGSSLRNNSGNSCERGNPMTAEQANESTTGTNNQQLAQTNRPTQQNRRTQRPTMPTPQAQTAVDPRLAIFLEGHTNYQNFTAADFSSMTNTELRTITSAFAFKINPEALIPQSFIQQYSDTAATELAIVVQREAVRRGIPELYATAFLSGGIGGASKRLGSRDNGINPYVLAPLTYADGTTRQVPAPQIVNFQFAQDALALIAANETARQQGTYKPTTSLQVVVPQSATAAVARSNGLPTAVADNIASSTFSFPVADELAYLSGYASRAGASRNAGQLSLQYPTSAVCPAQRAGERIFDKNKPDIDVGLAWTAGYIQSDVDQMSAAQRTTALAACPIRAANR
jgi:hypothetical protein